MKWHKLTLNDYERDLLLHYIAARYLTYVQHDSRGSLFRKEKAEMRRLNFLCKKLEAA